MKEYKLNAREYSIDCHGLNFLCVLGRHINGGFVAIINWGVSAELSAHMSDEGYNATKILNALERSDYVGYLPSDREARSAIAYDLAVMIGEKIQNV